MSSNEGHFDDDCDTFSENKNTFAVHFNFLY